jgi:hypothetical protein
MSGKYISMFDIPLNPANKDFVKNFYHSNKCNEGSVTCFSIKHGALPCNNNLNQISVWRSIGDLKTLPRSHRVLNTAPAAAPKKL